MLATLRGNTTARDFIAAWMNWLDRIGNNTLLKGNSANAYMYHYCLGENSGSQAPGTYDYCGGGPQGQGITRDEQYGGWGAAFYINCNATAHWVPNINPPDMTTVVRNAFTLTICPGGSSLHGISNGDWFFAYANWNAPTDLPIVPNVLPAGLTQSSVPYFIVNLINTTGNTYTYNLATSPGGAPIPIVDTTTGYGWGPLDTLYHAATPSIDLGVDHSYLCQVRNSVNWIHAIGSSGAINPGHNPNQFANFT